MKKIYNKSLFTNALIITFLAFSLNSFSQTLSPTVNVSLSNLDCGQSSDLTIDVSQDPGETDIANSSFSSDAGSLNISNLIVGDTLGSANMTLSGGLTLNTTLVVGQTNPNSTTVLSVDNTGTRGTFTLSNNTNGIEIIATSPGDQNNTTQGYVSTATFNNLFTNPTSPSVFTFYSTITSELGQVDDQSFVQFLSCIDFSPTISMTISDNTCGSSTDVTIDVSQDAGEIDMANSTFLTDGGSFNLSALLPGTMVGYAVVNVGSISYTTDLFVQSVSTNSAIIYENVTSTNQTFLIENLSSGGVSVSTSSPGDNNYTTINGNSSTIVLQNIYTNTNSGVLTFSSSITSELGQIDNQSFNTSMSCSDFSPSVSSFLSSYECDSLTSLTITVSQDAGETDMSTALFTTDAGSFTISSMVIGDIIGTASFTNGLGTYTTNLSVSSLTATTASITDSLGNTFDIENSPTGGVSINATSPGDNNSTTNGNSSTVTFHDVFTNPNTSMINVTSTISSELGDLDVQSFVFNMACMDFSPTIAITLSNNTCSSLSDLTIDVSQDSVEVDISTALFVSDGGAFNITGLSLNDQVGSANILFSNGTAVLSSLELSLINSSDDFEIQSVDTSGNILGTFAVSNTVGGGVSILATSPPDGNSTTNGYVSSVTFNNLFVNPDSTSLNFTTTITSELGSVDSQSFSYLICCDPNQTILVTACDSFDWDGTTYDSTGTYTIVYTDVNGCDSTVTLDLIIIYSSSSNVTVTECDSFTWDGTTYDSTGTYIKVYTGSNGCDSVVTLDLTINYSSSSNVTVTECDSFTWDGITYDSTGSYTNVYTDINGCDSTVTLDLTINYSSSTTVSVTACNSFDWDGITYDSTGSYTNVFTDINGCDSVVTLDLTIIAGITDATVVQNGDTLTALATSGTPPYTYLWNTNETTQSIVPDSNGTYYCVIIDANGCEDWSNQYNYTSTNVEDLEINDFLLYPNPTSGSINIEFFNTKMKISSVSIVNVLGDKIYNQNIDKDLLKYSQNIDMSKYSNGIYFVRFKMDNGFVTRKLILQ